MSKVEELAKEYAEKFILTVDHQGDVEEAYIDGYHQAEKDNKLTWEDIQMIDDCLVAAIDTKSTKRSKEEFYKEVLKRFKKMKEDCL